MDNSSSQQETGNCPELNTVSLAQHHGSVGKPPGGKVPVVRSVPEAQRALDVWESQESTFCVITTRKMGLRPSDRVTNQTCEEENNKTSSKLITTHCQQLIAL